MSLHTKLMLPLIDKSLTLEDISDETGFVDVYTSDINRPGLVNHIFLLYKRIPTNEHFDVRKKLSDIPSLYSKRNIKINNILYTLFCFTINYPIKLIKSNSYLLLKKEEKEQIGKFWRFTDIDVTDFLLGYTYIGTEFSDNVIPEEDFNPSEFLTYDEKRGALCLSVPL